MKTKVVKILSALTLISVASVGAAAPPRIVTTTPDLADLARRIIGEPIETTTLCGPNEDAHFLQARPSFIVRARNADLWIRVGMELEDGWEGPVLIGSRNPRIQVGRPGHLDVSERVLKLEVPATRITREMGDVHPSGNPHYWLDPWNGRVMASHVAERSASLFPQRATTIAANLAEFQGELDTRMFGADLVAAYDGAALWEKQLAGNLDAFLEAEGAGDRLGGWLAALRPYRGREIVTYHKSWIYLANRFGMTVAAELEPKPGIPPTAAHLSQVEALVQARNIRIILQEMFYSRRAADRIAQRTGARVVVLPVHVGGTSEASDYLSLIDVVVQGLRDP